jgi:hypothetical protein
VVVGHPGVAADRCLLLPGILRQAAIRGQAVHMSEKHGNDRRDQSVCVAYLQRAVCQSERIGVQYKVEGDERLGA